MDVPNHPKQTSYIVLIVNNVPQNMLFLVLSPVFRIELIFVFKSSPTPLTFPQISEAGFFCQPP